MIRRLGTMALAVVIACIVDAPCDAESGDASIPYATLEAPTSTSEPIQELEGTADESDDEEGFFVFAVLVFGLIVLFFIGAGAVFALAVIAVVILVAMLFAILVAVGIVSISTAVGFLRWRVSSGVRTFVILLSTVAGAACGILAAVVAPHVLRAMSAVVLPWTRVILGAACGAVSGMIVALVLNSLLARLCASLSARIKPRL
ncbi:MAG: hypothetical protein JW889_08745 [Verrucomicrobia bacterium]|nr:hypothetical protein [Verrucomicrobiota bacterium]